MSKDVDFVIEELLKELALRLMEALYIIYNSDTYTKVLDLHTELYSQRTASVYSILEMEILREKLG